MSDLLSIGASGVRAYQTALSTVGENIANVGSAGYTRRAVQMNEVPGGSGSVNQYGAGNGVVLTGIVRAGDNYAAASLRASTSDLNRTTNGASWLDQIDGALTGNSLTSRVTSFFAASQSLAAEPGSTALRTTMLSAAGSAAIAFTATGQALDQVGTNLDIAGNQAATGLTSLGVSLASINEGLGRAAPGSTAAAQLMDQRDQILTQMSGIVDLNATFDSIGRTTVTLAGSTGTPFVKGNQTGTVAYSRDANGQASFSYTVNGAETALSPSGGTMGGIVDGAQRVAANRAQLNGIATDFANTVNANQLAGQDLAGATGTAMFTVGTAPTDLSVALTSGSQIAAAAPGGGARDATNLANLETARQSKGFEASLAGQITDNATALKQKNTIAAAQTSILSGAQTALSSASGVNLDSEAVDLMRFQQAYSASSRIIQVARETMQSILDIR
ncbi:MULTISPECIES: flagellar hook-associated protein FlgK [unclassified Sphingomonas]|jgi:flagellar hook-associated protein 1|uniref:flagellar hook-associated protein FlgK n=1 Tax=unclassified Sphingomonas TaxID=196159 RepID=UPI000E102505|nr:MULTISPECIES: flagellar hook-associated protein FlgK [unclassified Sphingomonas]AXJ95343.1 flagellar hook-associated protein FlgK [Sphingomonas sp. FARSPH]